MASLLWSPCYICSQTDTPGCRRRLISSSIKSFLNVWLQLEQAAFLCRHCFSVCERGANHMAAARAIFDTFDTIDIFHILIYF